MLSQRITALPGSQTALFDMTDLDTVEKSGINLKKSQESLAFLRLF